MIAFPILLALAVAWIGHACLWTSILSHLYGRPLAKTFLKLWRLFTGIVILAFPMLIPVRDTLAAQCYLWPCGILGGVIFPAITLYRVFRKPPECVVSETTRTVDFWPEHGSALIGKGKLDALSRLPGNGLFRLDVTELKLALPNLPAEWDGLTLIVVSDVHFHGTPSRLYFNRVMDELLAFPTPDLVCLIGDYVDTDTHHEWIRPVLGRLTATEGHFAVLGNHDRHHNPDRVRATLAEAGFTVIGNTWKQVTIRGVSCVVVGHEGPWFAPGPDVSAAPTGMFRLCLSHTPDNFPWAAEHGMNLVLCGHVHGGAIRIPVIGSIFVPSVYSRRYDQGVFTRGDTVMVVNRGVSGKEPIRFRCNPQVMRITLVRTA